MFTKIQESKWLKAILFITTFAFVGTGFVALIVYKLSGEISGVAQVNGIDITPQEFMYEVNKVEAQLQNQGQDISAFRKIIYSQVLNNIIDRELLYQFAKKEGIDAKDDEVKMVIVSIPAFQKNGKFDQNLLINYLKSAGISMQLFEEILKKQLTVGHIVSMLKAGFYITDYEVKTILEKYFSTINGEILIIKPTVKVSEKEIKDYYEKNKNKFAEKEGKKIKVYKIPLSEKEKAQQIFTSLKSGKKVEEKAYFDGLYLKNETTNLPKEVIKALNNLSENSKIEFVKTKDAFYLVYFEGTKSIPASFDKVKSKIENILKAEKERKIAKDIKQKLEKEKFSSLEEIAKKIKNASVKIEKLNNVKYTQLQIKYFINFEDIKDLIKKGIGISKPLLAGNKVLVVKIDKINPPSKEEYEKIVKSIKPQIENQKFQDIIDMLVNKLRDEAEIKINKRYLQ